MRVGTRSLLFGVHQVVLHPLFVGLAWCRFFGFPRDPRVLLAILVHDWGYWCCRSMDGPDGKRHPEAGARLMGRLFGPAWADFTRYHSRSAARAAGAQTSPLCVADKYALLYYPAWLYLALGYASGEIHEYFEEARQGATVRPEFVPYITTFLKTGKAIDWLRGVRAYLGHCALTELHALQARQTA